MRWIWLCCILDECDDFNVHTLFCLCVDQNWPTGWQVVWFHRDWCYVSQPKFDGISRNYDKHEIWLVLVGVLLASLSERPVANKLSTLVVQCPCATDSFPVLLSTHCCYPNRRLSISLVGCSGWKLWYILWKLGSYWKYFLKCMPLMLQILYCAGKDEAEMPVKHYAGKSCIINWDSCADVCCLSICSFTSIFSVISLS